MHQSRALVSIAILILITACCEQGPFVASSSVLRKEAGQAQSRIRTSQSPGGVVEANPDAAVSNDTHPSPREQAIADLIRAADTDLMQPINSETPAALARYSELAARAANREHPVQLSSTAATVAEALMRLDTTATVNALIRWIGNKTALPAHRYDALSQFRATATVATSCLVSLYREILAEEVWASAVFGEWRTGLPIGAFGVQCSGHCLALSALSRIDTPDARTLVREFAKDRSRSGPNPNTLAALTCPPDSHRDEFVAQALASERLIALALLQDKKLLKIVAADPTEPHFLRKWVNMILSGTSYWKRPKNVIHDDGPKPAYAAPCKERWYN